MGNKYTGDIRPGDILREQMHPSGPVTYTLIISLNEGFDLEDKKIVKLNLLSSPLHIEFEQLWRDGVKIWPEE